MTIKYSNLANARYELTQYLEGVGEHHPTRSFIERAIHDINTVMESELIIRACTPAPGYVNEKLNETGGY